MLPRQIIPHLSDTAYISERTRELWYHGFDHYMRYGECCCLSSSVYRLRNTHPSISVGRGRASIIMAMRASLFILTTAVAFVLYREGSRLVQSVRLFTESTFACR
jgi:hypothetical protein